MPGTLILVRHGESEWNAQKRFTGWTDVDLSDRGTREVEHAARLRTITATKNDAVKMLCSLVLFMFQF
jgi:bisphosphoglycerate-dependent phosphoglycerate mutase